MTEMVERVARAMCERAGTDWSDTSADGYAPALISRRFWMLQARAAIEAMRVPTKAMMDAGADFVYEAWGDGPTIAREAWQANIDAALH